MTLRIAITSMLVFLTFGGLVRAEYSQDELVDDYAIAFVASEMCKELAIDIETMVANMKKVGLYREEVSDPNSNFNQRVRAKITKLTIRFQKRDAGFRVQFCDKSYGAYGPDGTILKGILFQPETLLPPV